MMRATLSYIDDCWHGGRRAPGSAATMYVLQRSDRVDCFFAPSCATAAGLAAAVAAIPRVRYIKQCQHAVPAMTQPAGLPSEMSPPSAQLVQLTFVRSQVGNRHTAIQYQQLMTQLAGFRDVPAGKYRWTGNCLRTGQRAAAWSAAICCTLPLYIARAAHTRTSASLSSHT